MSDDEFPEITEPVMSEGQRTERTTGFLGGLARKHKVDLVGPDDFVLPFSVATGEVGEQARPPVNTAVGAGTGNGGGGQFFHVLSPDEEPTTPYRPTSGRIGGRSSRGDLESRFPIIKGRV